MKHTTQKILFFILGASLFITGTVFAAPIFRYDRTILPEQDSLYDLGTSTRAWRETHSDEFCLTGDSCISTWPVGGGGSGGGTWSTTTSQVSGQLVNYPNNATDIVTIGSNSTTTAEFYFDPNLVDAFLTSFRATNATSTHLSAVTSFNFLGTMITNVGTWFNGLFDTQLATKDTDDLTEGTNLYYTTARVNTDAPNVTLAGALDYLTLSGQQITRNAIDLAADVTGTLPVANGGTGSTTLSGILKGDGTNMVTTALPDTDYQVPLTFGDGLTRTTNDIDCDIASASVFGCLSTTDWTTFNSKLGSYDAWTHPEAGTSATTSALLVNNATSTITNLVMVNATSTNATTTTLYVGGSATSTLVGSVKAPCFTVDGNTCITGAGGSSNWTDGGTFLSPLTAGDGILINSATSTITILNTIFSSSTAITASGSLLVGTTSTSNLRNFVSTNSLGYGELFLIDPTAANYTSTSLGGSYLRSNEGLFTIQGMRPSDGSGGGVNFTIDQVNTRVGIASNTPKAALSVDNVLTHNSFVVNDEASDASPFVINASGNVGIGTTTPNQKIVLDNGATRGNISLGETAAGNPFIFINNTLAAASLGSGIRFQKNYVNQFGFGTDYAGNGSLDWWVYDYIAAQPRFLIDAAGEIGIGTTSPITKLDIVGTHGTRPSPVTGTLLSLSNTLTTTGNTYASIVSGNNAEAGIYLGDQNDVDIGGIIYTHGTNNLGFRTNNTADRMTITSAGDVGVATTSPWTTLSVAGTGNFSNKLSLGDVISFYGTAPTVSDCGDSPTIVGTKGAGSFTMGTTMGTTCNLIFPTPFPRAPSCVISQRNGGGRFSYSASPNGLYGTSTIGNFADGEIVDYHCNEI